MVYVTYQNTKVKLPTDQNSVPIQGAIPYTGGQTTTVTSNGTASTAVRITTGHTNSPQLVRVTTVNDGFIIFGGEDVAAPVAPTAGNPTECMYLLSGTSTLIALRPGDTHYRTIWLTSGDFTVYVTAIGEYTGTMG